MSGYEPGLGFMETDWEERINYDKMRNDRVTRAKQAVKDAGVDAAFVFRLWNVRYLTGLRTHMWPGILFGTASAVLANGGEPLLFSPDIEHIDARMPWMKGRAFYHAHSIETPVGARNWCLDVKEKLAGQGIVNPEKIGVDSWPPALYDVIKEVFPHTKFVDGESIMVKARQVKNLEEIKCLKMAYSITVRGFETGLQMLRPGVKECEILAACFKGMYEVGSEWSQCANIVCSGPNTAPYRRFTSDRIIDYGEPVIIDIGGCFNGYWGDFTRAFLCGENVKPRKELVDLHMQVYDTLQATCAAIKPGRTTRDVALELGEKSVILGVLGHGIGIAPLEPPFLLSPDLIPEGEEVVIEPNMFFSVEPYAGIPGIGGIRLEENMLVTDTGCEIINKYPFDARLMR
jgi:Xaa-Pro aminopeptidase